MFTFKQLLQLLVFLIVLVNNTSAMEKEITYSLQALATHFPETYTASALIGDIKSDPVMYQPKKTSIEWPFDVQALATLERLAKPNTATPSDLTFSQALRALNACEFLDISNSAARHKAALFLFKALRSDKAVYRNVGANPTDDQIRKFFDGMHTNAINSIFSAIVPMYMPVYTKMETHFLLPPYFAFSDLSIQKKRLHPKESFMLTTPKGEVVVISPEQVAITGAHGNTINHSLEYPVIPDTAQLIRLNKSYCLCLEPKNRFTSLNVINLETLGQRMYEAGHWIDTISSSKQGPSVIASNTGIVNVWHVNNAGANPSFTYKINGNNHINNVFLYPNGDHVIIEEYNQDSPTVKTIKHDVYNIRNGNKRFALKGPSNNCLYNLCFHDNDLIIGCQKYSYSDRVNPKEINVWNRNNGKLVCSHELVDNEGYCPQTLCNVPSSDTVIIVYKKDTIGDSASKILVLQNPQNKQPSVTLPPDTHIIKGNIDLKKAVFNNSSKTIFFPVVHSVTSPQNEVSEQHSVMQLNYDLPMPPVAVNQTSLNNDNYQDAASAEINSLCLSPDAQELSILRKDGSEEIYRPLSLSEMYEKFLQEQ